MSSLHIEHNVTDLAEWYETFSTFEEFRSQGGVTSVSVRHGVDDPSLVAVDLEFGSTAEARSFLELLETQVWPNSPHLGGGIPQSRILEPVGVSA